MSIVRFAVLVASLAFAGIGHAAEIVLKNAWMRPAAGGAPAARAYVDIVSDASVELVAAKTPVAKRVEIVRVPKVGDPASEQVVKSFTVLGGTTTRLAYLGDHLRLVGVTRDLANGDPVPLTLTFKDASGKRKDATIDVLVRGLLLPQQMPESVRDAPPGSRVRP